MTKEKKAKCPFPDCEYIGTTRGLGIHNGMKHDGKEPPEPEGNSVGRPSKLTEQKAKKLEQAASIGCNQKEMAAYAEISPKTLRRWMEKHEDLCRRIEQKKQKPILKAKKTIYEKLDDSFQNALKYLERKKPEEFSKRMEHTGPEGQQFAIKVESYEENEGSDKNDKSNSSGKTKEGLENTA
jgi:hypothetical protein